jgi:hypothetical protein
LFPGGIGPELKGHAPEDQTKEQGHERDIEGREQDRIHHWEGDKDSSSPQNQPGLIGIPHRSDTVHHKIPLFFVSGTWKQKADPKTEPIEDDIEDEDESQEACPRDNEIHHSTSLFL